MRYLTILTLLCAIAVSASAATVTSTTTGGNWDDKNTWIGAAVPSAGDDVVIDGTVSVTGTTTCRHITINSNKVLQNGGGLGWTTLFVTGNCTNNGTIRNNPAGNVFGIEIHGNIVNNSVWTPASTYIPVISAQTISQAAGTSFSGNFSLSEASGKVDTAALLTAASSLTFTATFDLRWYRIDMAGHALTIQGVAPGPRYGTVLNCSDVTFMNGAYLSDITYTGAVVFHGGAQMNTPVTIAGDLTVADSLENLSGLGWTTLIVTGDVTNNGVICNNPRGNLFNIEVRGDLMNNGTWRPDNTFIPLTTAQSIGQAAGKSYDGGFHLNHQSGYVDTLADLTAATALTFTGTFDLRWFRIDMGGHALTITGSVPGPRWGTVRNCPDLYFVRDAFLSDVTYQSNIVMHGAAQINSGVTVAGNLTVADSLENLQGLGWTTLIVTGGLTNNGVICNNPRGNVFALEVRGDLMNNGTWHPENTYIPLTTAQSIGQAVGTTYDGGFNLSHQSGYVDTLADLTATTPLTFTGVFEMRWYHIDMGGHALTVKGAAPGPLRGTVHRCPDLYYVNESYSQQVTFTGTTVLHGTAQMEGGVSFENVTVLDSLLNHPGLGWVTVITTGTLINNGVVASNPRGNSLEVEARGSVVNNGRWLATRTYLGGYGKRTVDLRGATTVTSILGPGVLLVGENVVPNFNMSSGSVLLITPLASLTVESGVINLGGQFVNRGRLVLPIAVQPGTTDYWFFSGRARFEDGNVPDSLIVEQFGYQTPQVYGNAIQQWFRLRTVPANKPLRWFRMVYASDMINGNNKSTLQMIRSSDDGATWNVINDPQITRDTSTNVVEIDSVPASGAFSLTSSTVPVAAKPNIVVQLIGRQSIRVGVPSRYVVYVYNNSGTTTDNILVPVCTGSKLHIVRAELPSLSGSTMEVLPIDSLRFEGDPDSVALFLVGALGAHEDAIFDVYVTADPVSNATKILPHSQVIDPVTLFIVTAIGVYVATKTMDYVGDKAVEHINQWETLPPAKQKEYLDQVKRETEQQMKWDQENGKKVWAGKKIAIFIASKLSGVVGGAIEVGVSAVKNIGKVGSALYTKAKQWWNREPGYNSGDKTQSGDFQPEVSGSSMSLNRVRSWDPNSKDGPSGYGDNHYITTLGPMFYTIFFENKAAATAPAGTIVILDTLAAEFDPTTVVFGRTSHTPCTFTKSGNVLRWQFDNIELPPNANPPEGEGWVTFTATPKQGLPSGTSIKNHAVIVFDANPPLATPEYVNILDVVPPTTVMQPIAASITADSVTLQWTSSDPTPGSGLDAVTIYMSYNNGPYVPAGVAGLEGNGVIKIPRTGHYAFTALARDLVGNVERTLPVAVESDITTSDVREPVILPGSFATIYPNPVHGVMTIDVSDATMHVGEVVIVNMLGAEVARLRSGDAQRFTWDASRVPAGVYAALFRSRTAQRAAAIVVTH